MAEVFEAKLRKIGSSVGVLIPQDHLKALKADVGDTVEVGLLRHRNPREIMEGFGMAKEFRQLFKRDKKVRYF